MSKQASRVLVFLLVISVAFTLTSPAVGHAPPKGICGFCGGELEERAEYDHDLSIETGESHLNISIHENGTGVWEGRVRLSGSGVEELESNQTLLRDVVKASINDKYYRDRYYRKDIKDPRNLRVGISNSTLKVSFAIPEMASRGVGGTLVMDYFYRENGHSPRFRIDADEIVVRGPEGMSVTRKPDLSRSEGNKVVLVQTEEEEGGPHPFDNTIDSSGFVVYAPGNGLIASGATHLSVTMEVFDGKVLDIAKLGILPVVLLGLFTRFLWKLREREKPVLNRTEKYISLEKLGSGIIIGGASVALIMMYVDNDTIPIGSLVIPVTMICGSLLLLIDWENKRRNGRTQNGIKSSFGIYSLVAGAAVLGFGFLLTIVSLFLSPALLSLMGVPGLLFLPLGYATERTDNPWVERFLVTAITLSPVAWASMVAVGSLPVDSVFTVSILTVFAAGSALLGIPLFFVGKNLGVKRREGGDKTESASA